MSGYSLGGVLVSSRTHADGKRLYPRRTSTNDTTRTVTVVGAGDMGHGSVAHFALHGLDVSLVDHRQSNLDRARGRIREVVESHHEEGLAITSSEEVLAGVETTLDREAGVAPTEDVNAAIRDGYARRTSVIGPFETMDVAGLGLFRTVAADRYPHLSDAEEPGDPFDEYLARDRGGIEDGAGFFEYGDPPEAVTRSRDEQLAALARLFDERRD